MVSGNYVCEQYIRQTPLFNMHDFQLSNYTMVLYHNCNGWPACPGPRKERMIRMYYVINNISRYFPERWIAYSTVTDFQGKYASEATWTDVIMVAVSPEAGPRNMFHNGE